MKKVNQDPFSNGTEFMDWDERNCQQCIKGSRMKKYSDPDYPDYTPLRCAIQRDIFVRMVSDKQPISQRSYDACQNADCPYRKEKWPKKARYTQKEKLL